LHAGLKTFNRIGCGLLLAAAGTAAGQTVAPLAGPAHSLSPLAAGEPPALVSAWLAAGLPDTRIPRGRFTAVMLDGEPALSLQTSSSYGMLLHDLRAPLAGWLQWQWRLDQALARADLRQRGADDAALKVCAMFDQPLADMPLRESLALRLARATSAQALPAATVCYVWDSKYPAGSSGANVYSGRVRYIVVQGAGAPLAQWVTHTRDLAHDFMQLFGRESAQVPPLLALAVGADSDNTQGNSLGYIRRMAWRPAPPAKP
jgi:hypothetical protein